MVVGMTAWLAAVLAFAGPKLQLPYECGKVESCTQGHGGGSHTGASTYAWDFVLQEGEEIWAASAGVVTHRRMSSDTGGCNPAYATEGNYITIDHGDGTSIIYAHMAYQSSPLKVGDAVEVGDLIGRVGTTGYVCGAHLHMAVQDQCGSSHCESVPASFEEYGDPGAGDALESLNCPVCQKTLDGGTTVVEEEDAGCLDRKKTAWYSANNGHEGHHFYTFATDAADDDVRALWRFDVDVPGDYEVEVYVPDMATNTTNARYVVRNAEGNDEVFVDQTSQKGWVSLGVFSFVGGPDEAIKLGDMTGEPTADKRKIAYDAVRFTFVASVDGDETGGTTGPDPDPDPDPTATTGENTTGDGDEATTTAAPEPPTGDGSEGLPHGFGGVAGDGGCTCRSTERPAPWLWALPLLWWRRRARVAAARRSWAP